jgi:hypothetical protein
MVLLVFGDKIQLSLKTENAGFRRECLYIRVTVPSKTAQSERLDQKHSVTERTLGIEATLTS